MIFAYNPSQIFLPNHNKIFGSHFIKIDSPSKYEDAKVHLDGKNYYQDFEITRTHWLRLDHTNLRCNHEERGDNTTKCITEYLEAHIGCSMGLQGSDPGVKRLVQKLHYITSIPCFYALLQLGVIHQLNLKHMPCLTTNYTWAMRQRSLHSQAVYPAVI